ncbi:MAG: AAA family ATPase [Steroidobacteraceae bacterium]
MSASGPEWSERVRSELGKAVLGKTEIVERLQIALLVGGHVLLEGMPGLAKTLLVKSLGRVLDLKFERIQFTPDLLPSDVVGTMIYMPNTGTFSPHLGPVFANLVLADEINRSPAKVQSALLEAMGERQVTIGGTTHPLPEPFFVMATQNPLEQEGTYPLPEAQTDRFLFKLVLGYPGVEEELEMLHRWGGVSKTPSLTAVSSGVELMAMRAQIDSIHVAPAIERYIVDLIQRSRDLAVGESASRVLDYGSSPRGTLALFQAARALAWIRGLDHVVPAIVQELLPDVLRHRIALTYESQAAGSTVEKLISEIIDSVAIP